MNLALSGVQSVIEKLSESILILILILYGLIIAIESIEKYNDSELVQI